MIYIFDVEGTLSRSEWRVPLLPPKGLDHKKSAEYYMAFHNAFPKDSPYKPVVSILKDVMRSGARDFFILTGMMERHREKLTKWIEENIGYPNDDQIIMRADDDFRSSPEFKLETIKEKFPKEFENKEIIMFDDRQDIVDIMTANGIHCFKVNQI